MRNQEVAALLYEIANLMEIRDEMVFKVVAYRRAAQNIESLTKDIADITREGKLTELPGIGKGIAEVIEEYLKTGKSEHLDELRKGLPEGLVDLLELEGIGPKKVKLFLKHKIKNIKDLEKAAKEGRLRRIEGLGEKTEKNILESIENSRKRSGRMLLGQAMPIAEEIISYLRKSGYADKISAAGSIRRRKETIGDIDILATSKNPGKIIDFFTKMTGSRTIVKGPTKASIVINGTQVDLRVLPPGEYGSALLYFTGSKEHNVELRRIAITKRLKLSEYGLFSGNKFVAGRAEEDVYRKLGMDFIEPEMREARGEIEAAQKHKLPKLVELKDIRGDLQMHTKWSDGANTIGEMSSAAKRLGYEYICVTDHVGNMKVANALDKKRLEKQRAEISDVQKKLDIRILQGAEIDIRVDGSLDVDNSVLKDLDIVLASLHSALKSGNNTRRILAAMDNPHVDIIAHPSGRLIDRRNVTELDMGKIIDKSKETGTILEINSQPNRLDINDVQAKMAIEHGCKIAINTDAHSISQLAFMHLGVATARRGWAAKGDVINTLNSGKMLKMLK